MLCAGDRLPSTRALADRLAVNRNTVVAAFDELAAQGWVTSQGSAGTFVAAALPDRARAARGGGHPRIRGARAVPEVIAASPHRGRRSGPADVRFQLSAGFPDPRLFPRAVMARAYRRALRAPSANTTLGYGDPAGSRRLREAIAAMLRATRAVPATAENILITSGSQGALDLIARALIRPGDPVAVEELGYQPAWRAFESAGAKLVPVAIDDAGLVVDELRKPRCVYTTPHHQYPTTVLMPPTRRLALLERARRDRFAIVEDDYDHEFHFDGRPVAPLASADPDGCVIYVGTLSKILAPGLRLGFIAAPSAAIATLAAIRAGIDRQGDQVLETAVAELVEDGELQRHAHKMRRIYAGRRAAFAELLVRHLGDVLAFQLAPGGITLWARVADGIKIDAWQARARARGVAFTAARTFALDRRPRPFIRLAFARYSEVELAEAVRVLRATVVTR